MYVDSYYAYMRLFIFLYVLTMQRTDNGFRAIGRNKDGKLNPQEWLMYDYDY
jgi:hypothetical protein